MTPFASSPPHLPRRTAALLPYVLGGLLTAAFIVLFLLVDRGRTQAWDNAISLAVHRLATPSVVAVMRGFTFLGTHAGTAPLIVTVLAVLAMRRRFNLALGFALITVGGEGPVEWIKMLMERPRPHLWASAYTADGFSFPSGHAAYAVILPAALVILA